MLVPSPVRADGWTMGAFQLDISMSRRWREREKPSPPLQFSPHPALFGEQTAASSPSSLSGSRGSHSSWPTTPSPLPQLVVWAENSHTCQSWIERDPLCLMGPGPGDGWDGSEGWGGGEEEREKKKEGGRGKKSIRVDPDILQEVSWNKRLRENRPGYYQLKGEWFRVAKCQDYLWEPIEEMCALKRQDCSENQISLQPNSIHLYSQFCIYLWARIPTVIDLLEGRTANVHHYPCLLDGFVKQNKIRWLIHPIVLTDFVTLDGKMALLALSSIASRGQALGEHFTGHPDNRDTGEHGKVWIKDQESKLHIDLIYKVIEPSLSLQNCKSSTQNTEQRLPINSQQRAMALVSVPIQDSHPQK